MDNICIKARDSRGTVRTMSLCLDESTRDMPLMSDDLREDLYRLSFLAAEIEKCYNECLKRAKITDLEYWNAKADAYRNVLVFFAEHVGVEGPNCRP